MMRQKESIHTLGLFAIATAMTLCLAAAPTNAAVTTVIDEDFEAPDVTAANSDGFTSGAVPSGWVGATNGFGASRRGVVDESHGDFTDPDGEQAFAFRYTNSGLTSALGEIGVLTAKTLYTVTFDVVLDGHSAGTAGSPYSAGLVTFAGGANRADMTSGISDQASLVLDSLSGSYTGTTYETLSFSYLTGDIADGAVIGQDVAVRFGGATSSAIIDNVIVTTELVPAPSALPAGLALLGLAAMRRRRR